MRNILFDRKKNPIKWFWACGKPWYKKWWVWALFTVTLVILVVIPFLINYAYMKGLKLSEPNTVFTASDLLSFYGTILGAAAAIITLIATIRFTAYQSLQEQKHQRNKLIADYKEVELKRKYNEMLEYAEKIKSLYLLEMINDKGHWLERLFDQNYMRRFISVYENFQYWAQKLNLSNSSEEKSFQTLLNDFENNVRNAATIYKKEIDDLHKYCNEYDTKKQVFESRKEKFKQENPMHLIERKLNNNSSPKFPYGEFKLEEPESINVVNERFVEKLKVYRNKSKDYFIVAFDALIEYKRSVLLEKTANLYKVKEQLIDGQ